MVRAAADGSGPAAGSLVVGHPAAGGWSERVAVATSALAQLPDGVEMAEAAALPLAGLTALRLLRAAGPIAGARVLLTGASGGVGHYVTELAAAVGADLTAVSRRPERLLALGATTAVPTLGGARGPFDVVLESVGGASLPQALGLLRRGGRLIWFGQASRTPVTLDFFSYFEQTGATIRHFHYEDSDVPANDDLATLVRLAHARQAAPRDRPHRRLDPRRRGPGRSARATRPRQRGPAHPPERRHDVIHPPDAKTVLARYVAAVEAEDGETIGASFADDATWTLAGELPISGTWVGRQAIVSEFLADPRCRTTRPARSPSRSPG